MAQLGDAQLDTGGRPSWGCDSQRQFWCQQMEIVVSKVLGRARKASSRTQTLAGLSGDDTRQSVPCHPWGPHETAPPVLHPTTPSTCLVPQQDREVHCFAESNLPHPPIPGRGAWGDSGKPLHVAERTPRALAVTSKQLLRWQMIFFSD